jgi:hypothetical protein
MLTERRVLLWSPIYWISPLRSALGTRRRNAPCMHGFSRAGIHPIGQGRNVFDIDAITVTANDALLPSAKLADPLSQFRLPRGGFRAICECALSVVHKSR